MLVATKELVEDDILEELYSWKRKKEYALITKEPTRYHSRYCRANSKKGIMKRIDWLFTLINA